ncbi:MAG: hypothetical protein GX347_02155 [Epulopiscium sp.]|nr:hypothetical protein [Candidatus Epulonipiscium sp.]
MKEERMLILRLLQENKITAEEAERLLTAVGHSNISEMSEKEVKRWNKDMERKLKDLGDTLEDWGKDFGKKIDEVVKDVEPKLKKVTQIVVDKTTSAFDEISKELNKEECDCNHQEYDENCCHDEDHRCCEDKEQ